MRKNNRIKTTATAAVPNADHDGRKIRIFPYCCYSYKYSMPFQLLLLLVYVFFLVLVIPIQDQRCQKGRQCLNDHCDVRFAVALSPSRTYSHSLHPPSLPLSNQFQFNPTVSSKGPSSFKMGDIFHIHYKIPRSSFSSSMLFSSPATSSASEAEKDYDDSNEREREFYHTVSHQQQTKRKNKRNSKMEWLLRTTSQIILNHNDSHSVGDSQTQTLLEQFEGTDTDSEDAEPTTQRRTSSSIIIITTTTMYPIGSLPTTLVHKIPILMNTWMKEYASLSTNDDNNRNNKCNSKNTKKDSITIAFIVEKLFERYVEELFACNQYFMTDYIQSGNSDSVAENTIAITSPIGSATVTTIKINADLYNMVIEAWMNASGQEGEKDIDNHNTPENLLQFQNMELEGKEFLSSLKQYYDFTNETNNEMAESSKAGTTKMKAPYAAVRAHHVLNKMEQLASKSNTYERTKNLHITVIHPDIKSYSLVLKAWVRSREYCSLQKMEEIFSRFEEFQQWQNQQTLYPQSSSKCNNDVSLQPTVQCYNLYLYALANSKESTSQKSLEINAEKAYCILQTLQSKNCSQSQKEDTNKRDRSDNLDHHHSGNGRSVRNLAPDVNTYNQVLSAFARTRSIRSATRAQSILDQMMKEADVTNVYPNTNTFNAVMGCWHKSGSKESSYHIEYILNLMNGLSKDVMGYQNAACDRYSVNTALSSIGRTSWRTKNLQRVHYILKNMESLYGVKPDTLSFNLVIDAYARNKNGGERAVHETQLLLTTMEDLFMDGNNNVMPDSCSYSAVINTISSQQKNGAGKSAEMIVRRMERFAKERDGKKPNTAVYNALMNCYATRGSRRDLGRVEAILRYMEGMNKVGNSRIKPNTISFNTVLKGYSQSKDNMTKKAEKLLERMESEELDVQPDIVSYTTVITTYARSSIPGKATKAKQILDRMIDAHCSGKNKALKPTIYPFNACLNACAFTFNRGEKLNAFVVVVETLVLIQKFAKPDHTTYLTVLKAWNNLIPKHDERRQVVVSSTFRQCRKEGLVGQMVMRQLQLSLTPRAYRELVGREITDDISIIPPSWSRNVR